MITLNERKDADIIEWLKKLSKNRCAGAIKTVLRCSLVNPCLIAYYEDPTDALPEAQPEREKIAAAASGTLSLAPPANSPKKENENVLEDDFDFFNLKMETE